MCSRSEAISLLSSGSLAKKTAAEWSKVLPNCCLKLSSASGLLANSSTVSLSTACSFSCCWAHFPSRLAGGMGAPHPPNELGFCELPAQASGQARVRRANMSLEIHENPRTGARKFRARVIESAIVQTEDQASLLETPRLRGVGLSFRKLGAGGHGPRHAPLRFSPSPRRCGWTPRCRTRRRPCRAER
jgi:hypothetical protein